LRAEEVTGTQNVGVKKRTKEEMESRKMDSKLEGIRK
jgi:hypothetical protein